MRWFHLFITIIYLSMLFSPSVKAVTASRVDVIGSGLNTQQAIMPLSQHLASSSAEHNDSPDDLALTCHSSLNINSVLRAAPVFVVSAAPFARALAAQPRAPPSLY